MQKTAADILETAARSYEAETVNWCQEAWVDPDLTDEYREPGWWSAVIGGDVPRLPEWRDMPNEAATRINACAMGALALADGWTWQQNMDLGTETICNSLGSLQLKQAIRALEVYVTRFNAKAENGDRCPDNIPSWNDWEDRTKAEVIEAMKATAKDLRNQEVAV